MYILDSENIREARITITLVFINIFTYIAFNIVLHIDFLLLFVQINSKILYDYQYWRLITSMFLHADVIHLFSNMVALFFFGAVVENNFPRYQYFIIYFVSGLIGNLFSLILLPLNIISLGASGAIFGLIGAAFILVAMEGDRFLLLLGLAYIAYFIVSSLAPGINLWAHLFGLAGGIIFGFLFNKRRRLKNYEYY
ncbi:MAG: rhomboid family intramembrane serine protease [Candidatus Lokiarchaeota archaeon]|nr:rhomboid family intramembrane serine protease [Candidatus Lokiarchaeota archaeon]